MTDTSVSTSCAKDGCGKIRTEENVYCAKHQILVFVDATVASGNKVCQNYIRGCRAQLDPNYAFSRCDPCRETERARDHARRATAAASAQVAADATEKSCTTCCKVLPMDMFRGEKGIITKTCRSCRDDNKKQDENRNREQRNSLARVAAAKPERKQNKRAYRDENPEKMVQYDLQAKANRLERLGAEGYLAHNATQAATFRANNPEKQTEFNKKRRTDLHEFFKSNYVYPLKYKNLEFTITEDDFIALASEPCFYCGIVEERGFNGLDRTDQTRGYVLENCVSACNMCNMMKISLHVNVFLKRVEHMVAYNFPSEHLAIRHPEFTQDSKGSDYNKSKKRSEEDLKLAFELTLDQFEGLKRQSCYLCGKQSSSSHMNGIDRLDSSVGYIVENCMPCCAGCNYIKRRYSHDELLKKLLAIFHHRILPSKMEPLTSQVEGLTNSFVEMTDIEPVHSLRAIQKGSKKSKEEIREEARLRKQRSRQHLIDTIGNEEYRNRRKEEKTTERLKNRVDTI